ncbi:hypothetical protein [Thiohalocapsa marina]|uniref:hypothetical protein n=1 Tax=Thiohalocapsa marina TaxID=424902 RepID=UPI0036D9ACF5
MTDTSPIETVSETALISRLRRHLRKEGRALRFRRPGSPWYSTLGDWHVLDLNRNFVVRTHCTLEQLGRETGCLKPYETLEQPNT